MSADAVIGWVLTIATGLRLSQAKTLADLVEAAVHVGRGTLSAIGRQLGGDTTAKHKIKRTWRFCDNDRVHPTDAMAGVVRRLLRKRRKVLVVALDGAEVHGFHTLMAGVALKRLAIPFLWASYTVRLDEYPIRKGLWRVLTNAEYQSDRAVTATWCFGGSGGRRRSETSRGSR